MKNHSSVFQRLILPGFALKVVVIGGLQTRSLDYRTFFRHLLGPLWPVFEISLALALVVILAVYAATAGAIGQALHTRPRQVGPLEASCTQATTLSERF